MNIIPTFWISLSISLCVQYFGEVRADMQTPAIGVLFSAETQTCFSTDAVMSGLLNIREMRQSRILWKRVDHNNSLLVSKDVCSLLDSGVRGVVTILPYNQQTTVMSQAAAFHFPNIVVDIRTFRLPVEKDFNIQINPPSDIPSRLIEDILCAVDWNKAALLIDDIIGVNQRHAIQLCVSGQLNQLDTYVLSASPGKSALVQPEIPLSPYKYYNFLYIGRGSALARFLRQREDLQDEEYYWIAITDMTSKEVKSTFASVRKTNFVLVTEMWRSCLEDAWPKQNNETQHTRHVVSEPEILNYLIDAVGLSSTAFSRADSPSNATLPVCSPFRPLPLQDGPHLMSRLLNEMEYFEKRRWAEKYQISTYTTNRDSSVSMVTVGEWKAKRGLVTTARNVFLNSFHDFGATPILVAATEAPPFINRVWEGGRRHYNGFSVDILDELAKYMKFNYTIIEPPDNFYGAPNPDGTWNGMVGMVKRGEAEIAIGPFTITSIRENVIDFTVPFSAGSTGIITLSPEFGANKSLFQTFKPYSAPVWLCVLTSVAVVGCTSYTINRYTPSQRRREDCPFQAMYETSLGDNLWMVYSSVTEQGIQHGPIAVSGRCLIGFWWLFTILLVATYTANLAAFLTISLPPPPINTLGELLAQDTIQPIVQAGTSFETIFQESSSKLYMKAWSRMKQSPKIPVQSEILDLVRTGDYAYVGDKPLLDYIASNSCLAFSVAPENFDSVGYGMVVPQAAPYIKTMNFLLVKMQEAGIMEKWRKKWWSPSSSCRSPSENIANSLGLDSLGGLFLSYVGIILIAGVCLIAEICLGSPMINSKMDDSNR